MSKSVRKNNKGKDLPRYKVVVGYEKAFKLQYAQQLGLALTNVIKKLDDFNTASNTGVNTNH